MNPLLERNKSIYRLLLFISAGMALLQALLMVIIWKEGLLLRILLPLLMLAANGVTLFFNHKDMSRDTYWQFFEGSGTGRLSFRKGKGLVSKPEDPDGWKYIKTGIQDILTTVFYLILFAWVVFSSWMPEIWTWVVGGILLIGDGIVELWYKRKVK